MGLHKKYPELNFATIRRILGLQIDIAYVESSGTSPFCREPTRHDYFLLMLFETGGGENIIDSVPYPIKPMQAHLYFPGQVHHWRPDPDTVVYEILMSGELFTAFAKYLKYPHSLYQRHPVIDLSPATFAQVLNELRGIRDEIAAKRGLVEIIHARLRILSLVIGRELYDVLPAIREHGKSLQLAMKFFDLVIRCCIQERSVTFYAEQLFITPTYLNILCRRFYGKTATSIIAEEVIDEIKYRIINTSDSFKEIAYEFNFSDISNFSTFFKKNTGMSPTAFRDNFAGTPFLSRAG